MNVRLSFDRDALADLCRRHHIRRLALFGSVLKGTAQTDSDVDFLVDVSPGTSLLGLAGMWNELHELLGRDIDLVTEGGLRKGPMERILSEAVSL